MATQAAPAAAPTAQQLAAQQKELARKLEECIEKSDRVLEGCAKTDNHPLGFTIQTVILTTIMNTAMLFFQNSS